MRSSIVVGERMYAIPKGRAQDFVQLASRRQEPRVRGLARRLAVSGAVLALLLGLGFAHAVQGSAPVEYETVTVQAGDTLWSLAERRYPNEDVRGRVAQIERENGLSDPVLHTGQTLRLRSP
jgi:nucleoid-associated protein YgaU